MPFLPKPKPKPLLKRFANSFKRVETRGLLENAGTTQFIKPFEAFIPQRAKQTHTIFRLNDAFSDLVGGMTFHAEKAREKPGFPLAKTWFKPRYSLNHASKVRAALSSNATSLAEFLGKFKENDRSDVLAWIGIDSKLAPIFKEHPKAFFDLAQATDYDAQRFTSLANDLRSFYKIPGHRYRFLRWYGKGRQASKQEVGELVEALQRLGEYE